MKKLLSGITLVSATLLALSCSQGSKSEISTENQVTAESTSTTDVVNDQPETTSTETDTSSFVSFISLFNQPDTGLPEWAIESFLGIENIGHATTKGVLETRPVYVVLYVHFMPVGPGMYNLHAASFTQDGTKLTDIVLGSSYPSSGPDGGGKDYTYGYDTDRHVLTVTNLSTDWNEESQQEVTTEVINFYLLEEDGSLANGRKYPQVSERNLDASSLMGYSKAELKIMRNEIFAVYGYIFKTEPLKSHYGAMRWYKPQHDNVENLLTDIEKSNVQVIKQVEDLK